MHCIVYCVHVLFKRYSYSQYYNSFTVIYFNYEGIIYIHSYKAIGLTYIS